MNRLCEIDPTVYGWLQLKHAEHWSKSHFKEKNNCDILLNNLCELLNSSILSTQKVGFHNVGRKRI